MCGILCIPDNEQAKAATQPATWRGPDETVTVQTQNYQLSFSRLKVVAVAQAQQPFCYMVNHYKVVALTNGEIYNHRELRRQLQDFATVHSMFDWNELLSPGERILLQKQLDLNNVENGADCDIIAKMLLYYGPDATFAALHGEFVSVIVLPGYIVAARDHFGVRPLFYGFDADQHLVIVSSINQIQHPNFVPNLQPFPPSQFLIYDLSTGSQIWQTFKPLTLQSCPSTAYLADTVFDPLPGIAAAFYDAVRMRCVQQEAYSWGCDPKQIKNTLKTGVLLSGGMDSSVVLAVAVDVVGPTALVAFTATFETVPTQDVIQSQALCRELGVEHHIVVLPTPTCSLMEACIRDLGTYDITTVRAGFAQWLMCQQLKAFRSVQVLLCGEGSDEASEGYQYFKLAPDSMAAHLETKRLLKEIYLFDGLRADRATAQFGYEVRLPFLDTRFIAQYQALAAADRFDRHLEKALLRHIMATTLAFRVPALQGPVAQRIIQRPKEAFSDSVGSTWIRALQHLAEENTPAVIPDYAHNSPRTKEALFYRQIFEKVFKGHYITHIPHFWMPRWCAADDPSARVLPCYTGDAKN